MKDPETKMTKETLYELLKDDQKKQLSKNNQAKMTLYNALSHKEYERVFICKTSKEVWHTLIITHQGNSQVKNCKIDLLTQQYEKFSISNYSSKNQVKAFLLALLLKWRVKVMAIEEAKDLATLPFDKLIGNLKVYEMILENNHITSKTTKEKEKVTKRKLKLSTKWQGTSSCSSGRAIDFDAVIKLVTGLIDSEEAAVMVLGIKAVQAQNKSMFVIISRKKVTSLMTTREALANNETKNLRHLEHTLSGRATRKAMLENYHCVTSACSTTLASVQQNVAIANGWVIKLKIVGILGHFKSDCPKWKFHKRVNEYQKEKSLRGSSVIANNVNVKKKPSHSA
uniref:UBN2 domain-containing protein n=1 Tax=Tanacetum cinerariifolium TaxID=118510 RepID=A0A6L2M920_TANCI|nr:hypothetical protein [Tanacetum cinerariifolium]